MQSGDRSARIERAAAARIYREFKSEKILERPRESEKKKTGKEQQRTTRGTQNEEAVSSEQKTTHAHTTYEERLTMKQIKNEK